MPNKTYQVRAVWDEESQVWISESDIIGLHIEARDIAEFERLVSEHAAELIVSNHISEKEIAQTPMRDLIPAIVMKEPRAA